MYLTKTFMTEMSYYCNYCTCSATWQLNVTPCSNETLSHHETRSYLSHKWLSCSFPSQHNIIQKHFHSHSCDQMVFLLLVCQIVVHCIICIHYLGPRCNRWRGIGVKPICGVSKYQHSTICVVYCRVTSIHALRTYICVPSSPFHQWLLRFLGNTVSEEIKEIPWFYVKARLFHGYQEVTTHLGFALSTGGFARKICALVSSLFPCSAFGFWVSSLC